jgi:cytochrome P450
LTTPELAAEYLGAEYFADPYSVHARLRARCPVTPVVLPGGDTQAWLITGYAEARAALADPRLRKSMPGWAPGPDSVFTVLERHMLNSDPPDHGRLRRLVNKAFTARHVERRGPRSTCSPRSRFRCRSR